MEKTKLGITVGLMGAAIYFMGLISIVPMILLAGYVLLLENNEWLKKAAVKAVAIYVVFAIIPILLGLVGNVFGILNIVVGWLPGTFRFEVIGSIDYLLMSAVDLVRTLVFLVCGFTAMSQGSIKVGLIDKIVNKNM